MKMFRRVLVGTLIISILISGMSVYAAEDDMSGEDAVLLIADDESVEEIEETTETDTTEASSEEEAAVEEEDAVEESEEEQPIIEVTFDELPEDTVFQQGIIIGTTDVSGLSLSDAVEAVNAEIEGLGQLPATIKIDDRSMETTLSEFGFHCTNTDESIVEGAVIGQVGTLIKRYKDIRDISVTSKVFDLTYDIEEASVKEYVEGNADEYTIQPVDATIKKVSSGFKYTESSNGIIVIPDKTIDIVMDAFNEWDHDSITVQAETEILYPVYTYEELSKVKDCIGSFYTKLSTNMNSGKGKNVLIGADKINGTLLLPGEEWSVYETLSPFTVENGYDAGTAYMNGGYVQEIGGGVCQLATTLYNASLRAEMTITERFCHQMTVGYTDISFDATVNDYGSKDFKLKNEFDFPVYIEAYFADNKVCFNIYGTETRDPRRTLGFRSEVLSEEYPTEVEETRDPSYPAGYREMVQKAYPAVVAVAYKQVFYDGVLIEETYLHTDKYHASPAKYIVGIG